MWKLFLDRAFSDFYGKDKIHWSDCLIVYEKWLKIYFSKLKYPWFLCMHGILNLKLNSGISNPYIWNPYDWQRYQPLVRTKRIVPITILSWFKFVFLRVFTFSRGWDKLTHSSFCDQSSHTPKRVPASAFRKNCFK